MSNPQRQPPVDRCPKHGTAWIGIDRERQALEHAAVGAGELLQTPVRQRLAAREQMATATTFE